PVFDGRAFPQCVIRHMKKNRKNKSYLRAVSAASGKVLRANCRSRQSADNYFYHGKISLAYVSQKKHLKSFAVRRIFDVPRRGSDSEKTASLWNEAVRASARCYSAAPSASVFSASTASLAFSLESICSRRRPKYPARFFACSASSR